MTDTTQHDPRARAQASLAEHFNKMQSVFSECVIKPQIDYQNGYITGYLALDEELTRLREQVIQQQARIVELHYYLSRAITTFRTIPKTVEKRARKVLATTDDLSALAEHDKQLWNEALTTGIEWQATRGHTLDADDYEHELRSLKR